MKDYQTVDKNLIVWNIIGLTNDCFLRLFKQTSTSDQLRQFQQIISFNWGNICKFWICYIVKQLNCLSIIMK